MRRVYLFYFTHHILRTEQKNDLIAESKWYFRRQIEVQYTDKPARNVRQLGLNFILSVRQRFAAAKHGGSKSASQCVRNAHTSSHYPNYSPLPGSCLRTCPIRRAGRNAVVEIHSGNLRTPAAWRRQRPRVANTEQRLWPEMRHKMMPFPVHWVVLTVELRGI